jgi:spore coat protein U-like protein
MDVTATVVEACAVTTNDLAFGNYDPTATDPTDATANIVVACTPGTIFTVALNQGTAPGATITDRRMVNGVNTLQYGLFSDATRLNNIGATPGLDALPAQTSTATPTVVPVFGRVLPQQKVPPGEYRDTVTVSVTY